MKIAVCACAGNENLYLREWVEHHINIGVDKIILYDCNLKTGEYPQYVIGDYINNGVVEVINKRSDTVYDDFVLTQTYLYNECLDTYSNEFDWILFLDIDEFLELEKYKDIHTLFENKQVYNAFEQINISWVVYGSNFPVLYYENKPLKERFPKYINCRLNTGIKSIVSTKTTKRFIYKKASPHRVPNIPTCTATGVDIWWPDDISIDLVGTVLDEMYIKHYMFKSFEEFLIKRLTTHPTLVYDRFGQYKECIGWSEEHDKMLNEFLKYRNV